MPLNRLLPKRRSPLIIAVIFITFFHNVLSRHKIRHFKDRFKRQQGANLYLPGSYVTDNYDPETGPWEEWSAPSPCSRTCGGGVSTQTRRCTQGYECTGPSARHFTCNTQDCPDHSNFRAQQCADHNKDPIEEVYYEWVPYTKAPNQCELNCMPKGERFYYRHAEAVVDGTRCSDNDEEYSVCVEGKCQPVGCDRMLGSNVREDQCRVCGGDGSTCNTFSNTIPLTDMQVGYNDILLIPAQATNIRIEELGPTNNYLAVRNKTGYYYLNGNWRIDFPKTLEFAGTRFKYDRYPQEFDAPDVLTSLGPTDETLFIVLLYEGSDVPINYTYSLPTSLPPPSTERYSWIYDEFTPCTTKCGRGFQFRNVSCAGRNSLEPVDPELCDRESRPEPVRACNEFDCDPVWIEQPWSECSFPCGEGGVRKRAVNCQKTNSDGSQEFVEDTQCSKVEKPITEEPCNVGKLCPKWHIDPWKPCDHLCGAGQETRKILCYIEKDGKKEILPDNECIMVEPKPDEARTCNVRPCEGVDWLMSQWSGCEQCGLTSETRKVFCASESGDIYPEETCDQERKPELTRECSAVKDVCQYLWYASQWSECSATCGQGVQTRILFCGAQTPDGIKKVSNDKCDPSKHFETIQNCTAEKTSCDGEWFGGPWGECSKPCGGGEKSKKVVCIQDNQVVDGSNCDAAKIEFSKDSCNEQPCSEDTIMPTDITQPVDESEPTKDTSQKREATTTPISTDSEVTKPSKMTTPVPDLEFEIVPSDNCDDGEWVDDNQQDEDDEMPQGDDPFAFEDLMLGDQPLLVGSGDGEGSSSSSSTWSTDSSTSTDSTWSTDSSLSTSEFEGSGSTTFDLTALQLESEVGAIKITTAVPSTGSTVEFTGSTESTTEFTGSTESTESTLEFTGSTESTESSTAGSSETTEEFTGSTESTESTTAGSTESTTEFTGSTESTESTTAGLTESTTEFTGSTESTESTTAGSTQSTPEYTGSTESTESATTGLTDSTTEFTGPTESTESTTAGLTETTTEFTGSTESTESTTEFTGSTESTESTTPGSTESTTEFTGSTESTESTTPGSTESTSEFTGSTESTESTTPGITESTTEFTGSTESTEITTPGSTESTTEFTGSTESTQITTPGSTESTTEFTGSTESTESTTSGSTESTTEFTGSTESTESTTPGSTESTTEFTGSTESTESTTIGSTESTTEFTGSTESTESTTEFTGSTESTESTTAISTESTPEFTGSTESTESTTAVSTESTTEFTGSTESTESTTAISTESTTEFTGSTESTESTTAVSTESTTEFTGSTESTESTTAVSTESTTEFTGSTESTESTTAVSTEITTEFTGSTESTESTTAVSTEITTEFTGSTESTESTTYVSTESTTEFTGSTETSESTTEFTGSTESTESTTEGSTESTTEFTGSTESTESTTELSTESTTEFTGSTESTESTTELSTESTTEFTGSTESSESTTELSTESTTEFTGSTESTESTTELSTESTTEFTGSTESTESTTEYGRSSITDIFTKKPRLCKRRKVKECMKSKFGCCWDNITPAEGPFDKGCPIPHTCKESKFGCCPDEVSPALGPKDAGCPRSQCKETLFGCCPDNKTPSEGNDNEGCPPLCLSSKYGCCDDNITVAQGPEHQGCPEESTSSISTTEYSTTEFSTTEFSTTEFSTESGETSESTTETGETGTTIEISTENVTENCETTPYRCCPDLVTTATGPGYQGCGLPCSESKFGCCQDAKTPANGPSGEGCCLRSQFGCCPDDITPANGLNNAGCDCHYSPYGCCPDNKTASQGYENEGCGCAYTEFGCCPDGYTAASGPDLQGCLCHTFQFGCCPDGINSAKGPHGQGCGCRNSEFGCCSDENTPASGPNMEGCTCENTKYGCCLDGTTEAKGENFEGCETVPENLQVGCSIERERGQCRNYTVKWFFDMDYGGCSRFWYGGCDGNENRYRSKEECEQLCVNPEGPARCRLPKVSGPCEGYYPQWYYDKNIKTCTQFVYGGCLGNNNRFETREECLDLCVKDSNSDPCKQKKEEGPCKGQYPRFFYNKESGQCEDLIYGGCQGNDNNFATIEACKQQCSPSGERKEYCTLPKQEGNCTDTLANWYYDTTKKRCAPFYYTGCNGNLNNFDTKERCDTECPPEIEKDTCQLPAETGNCANYVDRWYYDTREKGCRQFYYGGCGGNGNNFETQQRCQERCEIKPTPQEPEPIPSQPVTQGPSQSFSIDMCFLPSVTGNCRASFTKFFYDSSDGVCKSFIYGGCNGNGNNFDSIEECLQKCGSAQDLCILPVVKGPCEGSYTQYYYDQASDSCHPFVFGGCDGNYNRFQDQQSCEQRCKKTFTQAPYTQAPTSASQAALCFQSPDAGSCEDRITVFYYDSTRRLCQPFIYSGCGGNTNRFNSEEQCQRQCGEFRDQDVCRMQRDPGPCRGYFVKYYYDDTNRRCDQFAYGGCQGNGNRFSTQEECEQICITHEEKKPNITATAICRLPVDTGSCEARYHKRWYFDDARGECLAFIFSGCGGNFNNFKSFKTCIEYCKELLPPLPVEPQITTDMPPHPCQEAFDECTTLRCAYGVEPFVDENECNRCRCRDPCAEVECFEDEQCAIDLNINKTSPQDADYVAVCRKQNKPGECPVLEINDDDCEVECRTDADCNMHLKCCSMGCGTACVDPSPGQLVTQAGYTETPLEAQYQPPYVNTIEYKPEIAVAIGDQATLRCAVSGNPNPKIRWSKDNIVIDGTQPRYRIKLDQSLQIITLHKTDSGIYLCTASNGVGEAITNQVKLEVLDSEPRPVQMLEEPGDEQPVVVSLNAPATLNCFVLGYPFPAVTWWKDDSIIPFKNSEFEIRKDYSLLIHSVRLQNLGIYTCQAYNGYGQASSWSVTVKAQGPIQFSNPDDRKYSEFIVNQEEYGPVATQPSITTARVRPPPRTRPVPRTRPTTLPTTLPTTPTTPYEIPETEPSNEIFPILPDAQGGRPAPSLRVPVRANITIKDQRYPVGSEIEIPCEVSGYPIPYVKWYKDGVELIESEKIRIRETERESVLTIEQATKGDSGYYQCEASNDYNLASTTLEISIEGTYIHPNCVDNQFFANCALIVKAKYCSHKYYARFCCRSCTEAGLLPVDGPHIQNFNRQNSLNNNVV